MTKKNKSLKSGLVFSAAVAGSIIGNYHRAYALNCTSVTNNPAFGRLDTCDGAAGEADINITGDFAVDNQSDGQDENAAIMVMHNIVDSVDNTLNITLSSMDIRAENASGLSFFAAEYGYNGGGDNDLFLTINEDVNIDTTSDGFGGLFNFQEAVSINNSSDRGGSNTIVINGDITTRGFAVNGTPGFDDAIRVYKFATGATDITIGESSSIAAYDGGDGLYSYGGFGSDVVVDISGDILSEEGSGVVLLKGDSSIQTAPGLAGNMTVTINSTSEITAKKDAVFLFINHDNTQDINAKIIDFTTSANITSSDGSAVVIDGSSRFNGKRDEIRIESGANLTGKTSALYVKDNFSNIALAGGTDFSSQNDSDIVRLTGTDGVAIRLGGSTQQISIHDGNTLDHVTDFSDVVNHAEVIDTDGDANHTITVSGNVVVTGDIVGGQAAANDDGDIINFNAANLTLSGSEVSGFENILITEDSVISLTNSSSIFGATITANTDKTLDISLNASSINGGGNGTVVAFGTGDDSLTMSGNGSAITGNLNGGAGNDTLNFNNASNANLSFFTLVNFENIQVSGESAVNGAFNILASDVEIEGVNDGLLYAFGGISGVNGNAMNLTLNNLEIGTSAQDLITLANQNDSLTIKGVTTVGSGIVNGGAGNDDLIFDNANLTIGSASFTNFENLEIRGENIVDGDIDLSDMTFQAQQGSVLEMNGVLTSQTGLELPDGFTLNGDFTLEGDLVAGNGSTISPGATNDGIGAITINGNVAFEPGSTLHIDINGNNADSFIVNGAVEIVDGANLFINPIQGAAGSATIIQATGGINGSFSNVLTTAGSTITLLYTANNLELNYVSLNTNVLSAQIQSSVDTSLLFSDTLNKQIARGVFAKGRNFWFRNIHRDRDVSDSSLQTGFVDKSDGVAFGGETDFDESVRLGFSIAHVDSNINISNAQGGRDSNSYFAAAYANYKTTDNIFSSLALTLGYHDNRNSRLVNNGGVQSYARSNSHDKEVGLNFQVGKKFTLEKVWNVTPRFSASYIKTLAGSLKEIGGSAGNSAISVKSYEFSTLKFRESVRLERSNFFKLSNIEFAPYFELGLSQERALGERNISGTFLASDSNGSFTAKLKNNNRNFVTGTTGFNMQINKDVSAFVSYENAVSSQETRNDLNAGFGVKF